MSAQNHIKTLISRFPGLGECAPDIEKAIALVIRCYENSGKILTCGNGGSAADAEHIVGELLKGFCKCRPVPEETVLKLRELYPGDGDDIARNLQDPLPAIALTSHISFTTAYNNDKDARYTFAQGVYGLGQEGDVCIGLTTSGNSENIIIACKVSKARGLVTIALTGKDGGKIKDVCDVIIRVPAHETYIVQEYHMPVYHAICRAVEDHFFKK